MTELLLSLLLVIMLIYFVYKLNAVDMEKGKEY